MIINEAKLFNCKQKNLRINELKQINGHYGRVNSVSFTQDGQFLISCSNDKSIHFRDAKTGKIKIFFKVRARQNQYVPVLHQHLAVMKQCIYENKCQNQLVMLVCYMDGSLKLIQLVKKHQNIGSRNTQWNYVEISEQFSMLIALIKITQTNFLIIQT
ncbi:unnamed protein product (macronuclear) [Paramecium tetraurelia]|uniref:Uncharacterized protein n=1 Tax=Paramecium tetraurelia TaxID=5888 RepID=A0CP10_PARTE|nr:uncharacterized protein GSPATT00038796001 [Paramecium tetraurelia]CAK72527.1 unnamed protein product [Paramecium tetraurelia]|eukprot:XP_001439924.1 hypothetical protein (macronuclear) [Paramecium tetraurelia strain d4-2]